MSQKTITLELLRTELMALYHRDPRAEVAWLVHAADSLLELREARAQMAATRANALKDAIAIVEANDKPTAAALLREAVRVAEGAKPNG